MSKVIGVSVGADGAVWCCDALGSLYQYQGSWFRSPTAVATEVAVGSSLTVWCRNREGRAFKLQGGNYNDSWQQDTSASLLTTISAGADGTVWAGNIYGRLFKKEGNEWKQNPSAVAVEVAVGSANHVWYRSQDGRVFRLNGPGYDAGWTQDPLASMVTTIGVGQDGTVWVGNSLGQLYKKEGDEWKRNPSASAVQVSVGVADQVWCVNNAGQIYRLGGSAYDSGWLPVSAPQMPSWIYVVKEGDTLGEIVQAAFGLSGAALYQKVDEIAELNGISDPDEIEVGQVIVLQY
jgi:hypothetical protein